MPIKSDPSEATSIIQILEARFAQNLDRHLAIKWGDIQAKLVTSRSELESLQKMESTGGEPDVVGFDHETGKFLFMDCAPESPLGRRSLCYDRAGLESRKEHRPENSAIDLAAEMGIELLNEEQYRELQKLGQFDTKTSSWLKTPPEIRELGGSIFGDKRFRRVFIYHNGPQSYYNSRGFRGILRV